MLSQNPTTPSNSIAIDAMSGDLGPVEVVAGLRLAMDADSSLSPVTLVGNEPTLKAALAKRHLSHNPNVSILHSTEVITMDDKPIAALKTKKDASMIRAVELVKDGKASAALSCGNTGALMACGTLRLRQLPGVDRPALAAVIPRANGYFVLLDVGANPDATPHHLMHNAILGARYAQLIFNNPDPRVGLLTIGTEEGKGNTLSSETNTLLKAIAEQNLINYIGPMEGFQIFEDHVEVVICDGFVGNILIKSWESLVHFFTGNLKKELKANPIRIAGALLGSGAFKAIKKRTNPDLFSGAPLLGLRGNVLKAHGSSNRHAIKNAILAADKFVKQNIIDRLQTDIARANEICP